MTTSILHLALGQAPLIHEDRKRRLQWLLDAIEHREKEAQAAPRVDVAYAVAAAGPIAAAAAAGGMAAAGAVPLAAGALGAAGGAAAAAILGAYLELHYTGSSVAFCAATALFCAAIRAGYPAMSSFFFCFCACALFQLYLTFGAFLSPPTCVFVCVCVCVCVCVPQCSPTTSSCARSCCATS